MADCEDRGHRYEDGECVECGMSPLAVEIGALREELAAARKGHGDIRRELEAELAGARLEIASLRDEITDLRNAYADARAKPVSEPAITPVPMILGCPMCGARHIDEGEFATKPHHTHACQSCGMVWRPALIATVGVQFLPGFKGP